MNEERVRRVFDQIKLPPEQRQAMLDRLLQTQREERTIDRKSTRLNSSHMA